MQDRPGHDRRYAIDNTKITTELGWQPEYTFEGKPMWRTNGTFVIGNLCEEARVPVEKGNPRCLRQLYQSTMAGIEENVARLVKQEYSRLLDCEQAYIGWES